MTSPMNVTESSNVELKAVAPKPVINSATNSRNSNDSKTEEGTSTPIATMTTPKGNRKSTNMEILTIEASPTTSPTDTPFTPPPKFCGFEDADFFRKQLKVSKCYTGYQRREENLDVEFEKSKIQHGNEKILKTLSEKMKKGTVIQHEDEATPKRVFEEYLEATKTGTSIQHEDVKTLRDFLEKMKKGKVKPTNVACFALGSLHGPGDEPKRSLEQFAVLLKFMEILEISPDARNLMQDPAFSPADARFFAKYGFATVVDPEGFNSINEETLAIHLGSFDYIDRRAVEGHWPAAYINTGFPFSTRGQILQNKSKFEKKIWEWLFGTRRDSFKILFKKEDVKVWWECRMRRALMSRSYGWKDIPEVGICDGMAITQFFWRKALVGERCDCVEAAGLIAKASLHLFTNVVPMAKVIQDRSKNSNRDENIQ